jgi:hypothetical protein
MARRRNDMFRATTRITIVNIGQPSCAFHLRWDHDGSQLC